jgi:hypothetical protein
VAYSKNPNSRLIKDERNHFIKDQRCFEEELQRYQEINAIEDFNQDKNPYMSRFFLGEQGAPLP